MAIQNFRVDTCDTTWLGKIGKNWGGFVKVILTTLVFKFGFGFLDVATDQLSGTNHLNGEYGLSLYFIAGVRSDYKGAYGPHRLFGFLNFSFIWYYGILRTLQIAWKSNWSDLSMCWRATKVLFLACVAVAWPLLTVFL